MQDPVKSLVFALEKYPQQVEVLALDQVLLDSARSKPPKRPAYVKLAVPDECVKGLRGPADKRQDLLYLVRIPNAILQRCESPIILPGEI